MKEHAPTRTELLNIWAEANSALRLALGALRRSDPNGDFEQIEEFIDNNENGLAFDDLADAAQAEFVANDSVFAVQMKIAADRMKLPAGKRFGF